MWFPQLPLKEADGWGSREVEEMGPLDCQWLVKSRSICQNGDLFSSRGASSSRWSLPWAVSGIVIHWGIAAVGVAQVTLVKSLFVCQTSKKGQWRLQCTCTGISTTHFYCLISLKITNNFKAFLTHSQLKICQNACHVQNVIFRIATWTMLDAPKGRFKKQITFSKSIKNFARGLVFGCVTHHTLLRHACLVLRNILYSCSSVSAAVVLMSLLTALHRTQCSRGEWPSVATVWWYVKDEIKWGGQNASEEQD